MRLAIVLAIGIALAACEPPPPPAWHSPHPEGLPYYVSFDIGSAALSQPAEAAIGQAAAQYLHAGVHDLKVCIIGHTDTSGDDAANLVLSARRADAIGQRMTQLGVPPEVITTRGVGSSGILVPTGPGVEEPQNRFANIFISKSDRCGR